MGDVSRTQGFEQIGQCQPSSQVRNSLRWLRFVHAARNIPKGLFLTLPDAELYSGQAMLEFCIGYTFAPIICY